MNIDTAMNCLWAEVARYNEDSRVREAWQTLKSEVLGQPAHNSSSHEMPSLEEVISGICCVDRHLPIGDAFNSGIERCYNYIARHFGH